MNLIYIVEDDDNIREIEEYTLKNAGFEAMSFTDISQLTDAMNQKSPDLLIVDIMLPDGDGLQLVKNLRSSAQYRDLPIIVVTAKSGEIDIVKGLDYGADDYITKPFSVLELASRVKSLLRRTAKDDGNLEYDGLVINLQEHKVMIDDKEIILTSKEFGLLDLLLTNRNRVLSRNVMLEKVWGFDFVGETRTVDMHISTLRSKLGEWGKHIVTVRNLGYVIRTE